ncbi:MAG: CapA family protein [Balneolaceae bacterium]|nr:CapA family protein [Balneolaceae bacterium]
MDSYRSNDHPGLSRLTLCLSGDVMTGRGIDQVLPHSVRPRLYERYVTDARRYLQLAERENGSIPEEVSYDYIWGDALTELVHFNPEVRIINLETAVTTHAEPWPGKSIHYRMHPGNTPLLKEAGIDCAVLGNNHVMDWGYEGLNESLDSLRQAGVHTAGAGKTRKRAAKPAQLHTETGRVLVFSYGTATAGIPKAWEAREDRPGVNLLAHIDRKSAERVAADVKKNRHNGDRVIVSLHWGSNWGYQIPKSERQFARRLIESGCVDLVYGHSSHHRKGIEVYNGRLILYGCGDLINDYEGISGHEEFRDDLVLLYFPGLDADGILESLVMSPLQIRRFRLQRPSDESVEWLARLLDEQCGRFGHSVSLRSDGRLELQWKE